jgi:hypothetical protein
MGSVRSGSADASKRRRDERAVATISAMPSRWGGAEWVLLYFTDKRVIVARTAYVSLWWGVITLWPWLLAQQRARRQAGELAAMTAEAVLAADPANFELGYDDISSVEVKRRSILKSTVNIATPGGRHSFNSLRPKELDKGWVALRAVLGEKLEIL